MRAAAEIRRPDPGRGILAGWGGTPRLETGAVQAEGPETGVMKLGLAHGRDGLIVAPVATREGLPLPLLVMLHGAGASATDVLPMVEEIALARGVLVLLPDSRGQSWDMVRREYDGDVVFIDRALTAVATRFAVDVRRVALAGFSDGASYALSLGLTNGALFSDILAFSPGFMAPTRTEDDPRLFIRHGREDPILPLERCGRRLARALEALGHDLDYAEFSGGHVVRKEDVVAAFDRFLEKEAR